MYAALPIRIAFLIPLVALAGCAVTPEQKVRTALVDAGVSDSVAKCMARPMAHKLSIEQLLELKRLASLARTDPDKKMTPRRILRKVEALGDPEIVAVTSRAALGCAVLG
jgi:hypothetical protein